VEDAQGGITLGLADFCSLGVKEKEICIELTFDSPPLTPLLPAPTLSEGE
jgi:hypothetical protein